MANLTTDSTNYSQILIIIFPDILIVVFLAVIFNIAYFL